MGNIPGTDISTDYVIDHVLRQEGKILVDSSEGTSPGRVSSAPEDRTYYNPTDFTFADTDVRLLFPFINNSDIKLPGLNLLSISGHRDKYSVTSLGGTNIKSFVSGNRTVAGSLGFVVTNGETPFAQAIRTYANWKGTPGDVVFIHPDELPPFDLSVVFTNQAGQQATLQLKTVSIIDMATNISIRDIQLTEMYSFIAANVSTLINLPIQRDEVQLGLSDTVRMDPFFQASAGVGTGDSTGTGSGGSSSGSGTDIDFNPENPL